MLSRGGTVQPYTYPFQNGRWDQKWATFRHAPIWPLATAEWLSDASPCRGPCPRAMDGDQLHQSIAPSQMSSHVSTSTQVIFVNYLIKSCGWHGLGPNAHK